MDGRPTASGSTRPIEGSNDMQKSDLAAALLIEKVVRDAYSARRPGEVQPLQWAILRYLQRAEDTQRTPTWIARYVGVTAAPVSRALKTLEARGAILTSPSQRDARSIDVRLTPLGEALLREDPIRYVAAQIAHLPEDERAHFKQTLQTLVQRLGTNGKGAPDG